MHQPKVSRLGVCLFLPGCMSRVLSQCRRPSSTLTEGRVKSSWSKPKLARALRDTAADRARILGAFFLPEGAGDGGRRSPHRGLHWRRFAHMTVVTCWGVASGGGYLRTANEANEGGASCTRQSLCVRAGSFTKRVQR